MFSVGDVITGTALAKHYDKYWRFIVSNCLEQQPKEKKREHSKFKVIKPLPNKAEYDGMKTRRFRTTAESLIADGYGIVRELADEMQEAFDNTPESLQQGDIGQRREEAASALSSIADHGDSSLDNFPEIETVFYPALDDKSRSKRCGEAADMLRTASDAIKEFLENAEEEVGEREDLDSLASQLEDDSGELEGIDFPGMYG